MQQSKKVRYIIVLFLLGVSVVALVGWNICVGTVRIPLADIFASIRGEKIENSRILWGICCRLFFTIRSQDRLC